MIEEIVMMPLRKRFDAFRIVGGTVDAFAHVHRDDLILLAMQDEHRSRDGADVALDIVLVGDQQIERPTSTVEVSGASSTTAATGLSAASRTAWPEPSDSP